MDMGKKMIGIFALAAGIIGGVLATTKTMGKKLDVAKHYSEKHLELFLMMNQWVKVKQEGKNLASYLGKNNYKRIAVYGMSFAGETFIEELKDTEIEVVYGIDKNADKIFSVIDIVSPEEPLENTDAIIVTAISFYDEIKDMLSEKVDCPIISLEDILYEM